MRMKDRRSLVAGVEAIPCKVCMPLMVVPSNQRSQAGRMRAKCPIRACMSGRVYGGLVMIASALPYVSSAPASCPVAMSPA